MISENCEHFFSTHFDLWEHLTEDEKELICQNTKKATYKKGETIHRGSSDCLGIVYIKTGQLRAYMLSEDGREITLYRLFSGDSCILSASCILSEITFDVFISAEENCEVFIINSTTFHSIAEKNIYAEAYGYKMATSRFSDVMWAIQQILCMSFDKRLAIFILDELAKTGGNTIKLTHEQIAKYMGSAREVVSRMLKYFSEEGMVKLSRGGITILDKNKIKKLI